MSTNPQLKRIPVRRPLLLSIRRPLLLSIRRRLILSVRRRLILSIRRPLLLSIRRHLIHSVRRSLLLSILRIETAENFTARIATPYLIQRTDYILTASRKRILPVILIITRNVWELIKGKRDITDCFED